MDSQFLKTNTPWERMIVWLINPLEFNLRKFNSLEKNDTWKQISIYPTPKKITVQIKPLEKYTLRQKPLKKIHNQGIP